MLFDASLTSLGAGILLLLCLVRAIYSVWSNRYSKEPPFPPGPKTVPFLGNVHQLPVENQQKTFYDWGRQFGDIVFAKLFHSPVIIVNSLDVARELMEKRGGNYNDRPPFILLSELMGWDSTLTHIRFGERFRKHRKWMQSAFMTRPALNSYRPLQKRESHIMLAGLLTDPDAYVRHFTRFAAATLMEITYGHRVISESDLYVHLAERATSETVKAGSPARMLVDFFPILRHYPTWLPGATFKVEALHVRGLVKSMMDTPYEMVKRELEAGKALPSFTGNLLEEHHRKGTLSHEDETDIKGAAGTLYAAGTETTATVMTTFVFAMVRHPEVYRKAQEELDRVVGSERLPDFDDRDSLSYLNAVIKEVYRWHVPVPSGLPHFSMKDDEFRGYRIPECSMIIGNIWGMSQNADLYPEPEAFRPERFIGNPNDEIMDPKNIIFGFGRRLCPGKDFADSNVFLLAANIVATMDITRAKDAQGQEIVPPLEFTSGFVSRPKPFKCVFSPRSPRAVELIHQLNQSTEA
ncbi:cytochrome P450 [Cristinia sonorae]|uniref:Cytochrome P450 n=1 Tax=Cristinia sonorae TaxID=1940300 RepID=A0A8K0XMA6_9AGAR|nr:cytochrome P450 [Cristinia sonorae]